MSPSDIAISVPPKCTIPLSTEGASPVMAQWFLLKSEHPDALLFFRMGDFYELFFDDALAASHALDIALTARGSHKSKPIPMCGVPAAASSSYLAKLIRRGFRVAIVEQTQTPEILQKKNIKGPLHRAVVRLVTPGTLMEDELLESGRTNLLLALYSPLLNQSKRSKPHIKMGAAWVDISTGIFETAVITANTLAELLSRLEPAEIIGSKSEIPQDYHSRFGPDISPSDIKTAREHLEHAFSTKSIDSFGIFDDVEIIAAWMAIDYVRQCQVGKLPVLSRPCSQKASDILALDPATRASLEILQARDGTKEHTLLTAISRTLTSGGTRMLSGWISSPVTDINKIQERQQCWLYLKGVPLSIMKNLSDSLRATPDISRSLSRISVQRSQPRDLGSIRDGLLSGRDIAIWLEDMADKTGPLPLILQKAAKTLQNSRALQDLLCRALKSQLPFRLDETQGVIATGFDEQLDIARQVCDDSRRIIASLQEDYIRQYGVSSLKIRHHSQFGYIIDIPKGAATKLTTKDGLIQRQSTTTSLRFTTEYLAELDQKISEAAQNTVNRELQLIDTLVKAIVADDNLPQIADALSLIDVCQSASVLARTNRWCVPEVTDDLSFVLTACRHPVVEAALDKTRPFTPNHCDLSPDFRMMLLTGPNMAGKSTFLRQTALAIILAQSGMPVSAESARIGIVDRLFSRVGASDDLARGQSTFMVEMTETAAILNQAGPRSLVVVDEIGRGTATLDGLSIAWAVLESLHSTLQCRTIFATHFHELTVLCNTLTHMRPFTMSVREWNGELVFQYEVVAGQANHSWGVHVARMAGVPSLVVKRAFNLLNLLEKKQNKNSIFFCLSSQTHPPHPVAMTEKDDKKHKIMLDLFDRVKAIDPDSLTPKQALEALYSLKKNLI